MKGVGGPEAGLLRPGREEGVARGGQARLFGVLGDPVDHSLSPAMHNAAFAALGLPHLYLRFRVSPADLPAALREARALRMGGLNLTVPLKEAVLPLLDGLTPEAERIGAANTIVFREGGRRLHGHNTDGSGFLRGLRGLVRLRRAPVVLIGAGGAARAVGTALRLAGCGRIVVANRTPARGARLADRLARLGGEAIAVPLAALARGDVLSGAALVVNTTSTGLGAAALPVRHAATPRTCLFVDLVYAPAPTPFLRAAARGGRRTLDGGAMLLHQGALAFEAWTGRRAPRAAMARALRTAGLALTERGAAGSVGPRRPAMP
jgi:shikimate dehydrogenase